MMTSHGPDLRLTQEFDAVLAHPDDFAPKLAFAATCDSIGDADRAEFIRFALTDVERYRAGLPAAMPTRLYDVERSRGAEWAGPIAQRFKWYGFHRGFVEWIEIDARELLANATDIYRLAPIRRLRLTNVLSVMDELFASPHLARIVSLTLVDGQHLGDRVMQLLASSPYLGKLVSLAIGANDVTLAGIDALAASTSLPALMQIDSHRNPGNVNEDVGYDQGQIVDIVVSPHAAAIEAKHGRKPWLHTFEDHGRRMYEDEF
jgi:uncharacterized protein (TIGR02996 family)